MIKRALISVYDKEKILDLAKFLCDRGVEIISTGGTYDYLFKNNIKATELSDITKFEEMLDGRVKTLHPVVHGGILAMRDNPSHMEMLREKSINTIDMVVVNLYPFFEKCEEDISFEEKVEFIDIGGPTMLRAAAKNFKDVVVVSDKSDYSIVMEQLASGNEVEYELRKRLAGKVFNLMSSYDAAVANFLLEGKDASYLSLSYKKLCDLRYGENPHQSAAYYVSQGSNGAMKDIKLLQGKELSYNNIKDMDAAWKMVNEFEDIACIAVKHNTPCGAAIGKNSLEAYNKTFSCDETSIFGGVIALNCKIDKETAQEMIKTFLEVIIAPDFDETAIEVFSAKKNLRVVKASLKPQDKKEFISVDGGVLVQDRDINLDLGCDYKAVTKAKPTEEQMKDLIFAWRLVKHVKSNAIVVVQDERAVGIGGGQVSRIWAAEQALERGKGNVLASDAFFPFNDVVELVNKYGVKAIIQPGGSIRDEDSIKLCDEYGIAMIFTGMRHFKH